MVLIRTSVNSKLFGIHPNVDSTPHSSQIWKSRSLKIFGGTRLDSNSHEFPWMVALIYKNLEGQSFVECGGTLISQNVVLTAAHCILTFENSNLELIKVRMGHSNLASEDMIEVGIEGVEIHPGWQRSNGNVADIALIKLSEGVEFNSNVKPISLPKDYNEDDLANGHTFEKITVAGWGKLRHNQEIKHMTNGLHVWTPKLKKLHMNYVKTNDCVRHYRRRYGRTRGTSALLCAQGSFESSDSCIGDSGGPLMGITTSNQVEIIGIVSHGSYKCDSSKPAIHTRVSKFLPWIKDFINSAQP